ncbi:MAG: flagellar hook-basal body complex protein FliE [Bradyrhizobiaceae bacterium]|nr:flagellar hook-basal body complex protein FliE [Bradyrhizobiaceae bacterium]
MASPVAAANAYAALARITGANESASPASVLGAGKSGPSFGSLVEKALTGMAEQGQATDAKAMQLAAGKADLVDVVTAVAETEVAVETLVSVRDKVIQAYEEIFRMPI